MSLHQEVFVSLFFLSVVYGSNEVSNYEPPCFKYTPEYLKVCTLEDFNSTLCEVFEAVLGTLTPLNTTLSALSGYFGPFQNMVLFGAYTFQPNHFDFSTYSKGAASINLVIINPNSADIRIVPLSSIILTNNTFDCRQLNITGNNVTLVISGYTQNCKGANTTEIYLTIDIAIWQAYANETGSSIIFVDWGTSGLNCYGYPQLVFCLLSKIAEVLAVFLFNCIGCAKQLQLIGHSLGAQVVGYVARFLYLLGCLVWRMILLDPAGPLFTGMGLRCQVYLTKYAIIVIVVHCNPNMFGTNNFCIGTTILLINPQNCYIHPGCGLVPGVAVAFNPGCCHLYCLVIIRVLLQGHTLTGFLISDPSDISTVQKSVEVQLDKQMPNGYITVNTIDQGTSNPQVIVLCQDLVIEQVTELQDKVSQIVQSLSPTSVLKNVTQTITELL